MGMENRKIDYNIQFLFIIGFCIVSILIFYFIVYVLLKDSYVQSVRMENELIRSPDEPVPEYGAELQAAADLYA